MTSRFNTTDNMILDSPIDRFFVMFLIGLCCFIAITSLVETLRGGLHGSGGAWVRGGNSLEWNDRSASLRLALHPHNRTLHPVQLRNPG